MATVKKAKCITDEYYFVTKGRIYDVVDEQPGSIRVVDDEGDEIWFRKACFEEVPSWDLVSKATGKPIKETQIGGNHYSKLAIQPYEYTLANNLGGLEHTVIKYVTRWKDKGGVEDLKKARHTLDFLIEYTENNQNG